MRMVMCCRSGNNGCRRMLRGSESAASAVERVRQFASAESLPTGGSSAPVGIKCCGLTNDFRMRAPSMWLSRIGPVLLSRVDGHAIWVNTSALKIAGITRDTRDPPGGQIIRDDDGHPTGVLVDAAAALVEKYLPAADR